MWLAGRSYRLKVPESEVDNVQKMAKEADDKIMELKQQFAGRDDQDFIAMCLLIYATDSKHRQLEEEHKQAKNSLNFIIDTISKVIDK